MTKEQLRQEVLELPIGDRLELAEVIWESLDQEQAQPPIPDWQRRLLDERIAEDDAATEPGSPWHEVKRRILASL
jgi:putative addiction module component (TIGR02574 family)